jgi:hypothetical protein
MFHVEHCASFDTAASGLLRMTNFVTEQVMVSSA